MDTSKLPPLMEGSWTTSAHTAPEVRAVIEQAEDEWNLADRKSVV